MIKCLAIDDEPLALELIARYIQKTDGLELKGTMSSAHNALNFIQEKEVELMFLDINMPGINGMELSKQIPKNVKIIFTTAYSQYAAESYRIHALDYLLKPINYTTFVESVERAKDYFALQQESSSEYIFVRADFQLKKIGFNQLLFVENIKDYVRFYMADGSKIISLMSLKSLTELLPNEDFMQVHRSYIINLQKATNIGTTQVQIEGHTVPVSRKFKDSFLAHYRG